MTEKSEVPGMDVGDDPAEGASAREVEALVIRLLRHGIPEGEGISTVHRKTVPGAANLLAMAMAYLAVRFTDTNPDRLAAFDWHKMMLPFIAQARLDIAEVQAKKEPKH